MLDSISEARLALVHPELSRRVHQLEQFLSVDSVLIRVVRGLATYAEQDAIYAEGRTSPGKVVTNAQGGYSMHCFGLAVDIAPFIIGQPDWNADDTQWQDLLAKALTCGLAEGARWTHVKPDYPHFYPSEVPACPTDAMRQIFQNQGLQAVWDAVLPLTGEQKA